MKVCSEVGQIFPLKDPIDNLPTYDMLHMPKLSPTYDMLHIPKLSPTHFISFFSHQHLCSQIHSTFQKLFHGGDRFKLRHDEKPNQVQVNFWPNFRPNFSWIFKTEPVQCEPFRHLIPNSWRYPNLGKPHIIFIWPTWESILKILNTFKICTL